MTTAEACFKARRPLPIALAHHIAAHSEDDARCAVLARLYTALPAREQGECLTELRRMALETRQ